jgi:hypothetical protein
LGDFVRNRAAVNDLTIETLISKVGEIDNSLMNSIRSAAVFVNASPNVKGWGGDILLLTLGSQSD